MQQIERISGNDTAPTIQIPAEIHARVKAYRDTNMSHIREMIKSNIRKPTLADCFVYFAWEGLKKVHVRNQKEKPVFIERGVQPKSAFVGCKIAYHDNLRAGMADILNSIKTGEFESRPKPPKTVVSMRCIFITLVELGINGAVS